MLTYSSLLLAQAVAQDRQREVLNRASFAPVVLPTQPTTAVDFATVARSIAPSRLTRCGRAESQPTQRYAYCELSMFVHSRLSSRWNPL